MGGFDEQLRKILEGYANFLREKELALPKHQPYLVHWVRSFLLFARDHGGYTFEQTLDLFLAEVGGRVGTKPWQLQQAADAIRIYRYQYRGAKDDGEGGSPATGLNDEAAILARLREVIRLRHYAKSTEKTYLHWNRRFLAYRGGKGHTYALDIGACKVQCVGVTPFPADVAGVCRIGPAPARSGTTAPSQINPSCLAFSSGPATFSS